jgi:hypothetical protein
VNEKLKFKSTKVVALVGGVRIPGVEPETLLQFHLSSVSLEVGGMHALAKGKPYDSFQWTPGIFTWEERAPPVHEHTLLVVRSHEVLTRGPAIQTGSQSPDCQHLLCSTPWNRVVLSWHLVGFCNDNHWGENHVAIIDHQGLSQVLFEVYLVDGIQY